MKTVILAIAAPLLIAGSAYATVHADSSNRVFLDLRRGIAAATGQSYLAPQTETNRPITPVRTPPVAHGNSGRYVALGDSVAAGLGLSPAHNMPTDVACGRSDQAYPSLVAKKIDLSLSSFACSGATAQDLFSSQTAGSNDLSPQIEAAFKQGRPALITITVGANDARWVDFIRLCYVSHCDTKTSTTFANSYLQSLQLKLYYALFDINERSGGKPPQVYLTGYYDPFSSACQGVEPRITASELTWLQREQRDLNHTLQNIASNYQFVTYVPVSFAGHDICSGASWVQDLNDQAPFHPTAAGQQAIASSLLSALQKFARP